MGKISAYGEDTLPTIDDYTVSVDASGPVTKKVKWSSIGTMLFKVIGPLLYPVGTIYVETTGTNPNTTFGFGTWSAYAQGQALVGVAPSGTFSIPGTAVGNETHVLTVDEMPTHSHGISDPGHNHASNTSGQTVFTAGSTNRLTLSGGAQQVTWGDTVTSGSATGVTVNNAGSSSAHSIVQPSIPTYVWRRTV